MKYKFLIRDNTTSEERLYDENFEWEDDKYGTGEEKMLWQWTDGNYGCDCNRLLFFDRAGGGDTDAEIDCGSERFSVLHAIREDGTQVIVDRDEPSSQTNLT